MTLDAEQIFLQAQRAWLARAVPAYESFRLGCAQTFLAARCGPGDRLSFTVRTADGRTFVQLLSAGGAPPRPLLRGTYITGPVGTPLGFYRALPGGAPPPAAPPPNLAPDPLLTIATVEARARAYEIRLAGQEMVGGRLCDHLVLRPLLDPARYPLRDLWVEASDAQIVALRYARPYAARDTWAQVLYRFAPVGAARIWTIVSIEAEATVHGLFSQKTERVAATLDAIAFPQRVPDADFEPGPVTSAPPPG